MASIVGSEYGTEGAKLYKMSNNWRVIYVASRREKKVHKLLERDGTECFLPLIMVKRQWSDRVKQIEIPLFNGYVFVKCTDLNRDVILQSPGVIKLLNYNGADARVSDLTISSLKLAIEKGHTFLNTQEVDFKVGNRVIVTAGPFTGVEGRVVSYKNNNYVLIELEAIGKQICIKIEKSYLKNVKPKVG